MKKKQTFQLTPQVDCMLNFSNADVLQMFLLCSLVKNIVMSKYYMYWSGSIVLSGQLQVWKPQIICC